MTKPEARMKALHAVLFGRKVVPTELDQMAAAVLAYRPKPKSKAAKKRRRKAAKKAKG